jgi:hypothetical protein
MNIKNYTTGVPAERSIGEIEKLLSMFGCNAIMKDYSGDGKVVSLAFKYQNNAYKLPINTEGVYAVIFAKKRARHGVNVMRNREEQAYRIAWRLLKDWIHAQLSIVVSGQATPEQIMLPYMWDGRRTVYEAFKNGQLQIGGKVKESDEVKHV